MIYAYIESRGDTEDATWSMMDDLPFREYDSFADGMATLHEVAAQDMDADWSPQRRLVYYNSATGKTQYWVATSVQVDAGHTVISR